MLVVVLCVVWLVYLCVYVYSFVTPMLMTMVIITPTHKPSDNEHHTILY